MYDRDRLIRLVVTLLFALVVGYFCVGCVGAPTAPTPQRTGEPAIAPVTPREIVTLPPSLPVDLPVPDLARQQDQGTIGHLPHEPIRVVCSAQCLPGYRPVGCRCERGPISPPGPPNLPRR